MDSYESISSLIEKIEVAMSAIGLHADNLQPTQLGGVSEELADELAGELPTMDQIVDFVKSGKIEFAIVGQFRTADLAWTERTLHPDRFSEDTLLRELLPSDEDALQSALQEQIDAGIDPADVVIPEEFRDMGGE